MGNWLSEREQRLVAGAEEASAATPIPTQIVSNGEYLPPRQSATQKKVERRIVELADANAKRLGLDRRQFLRTSCGMAAAFVAMNEIYGGNVFQVTPAEAREPELAQARAQGLAGPVHLRRADPFRARRLRPQAASGPGRVREPALEPQDEGGGRGLARPLQVPELREGDLLRQRHQPGLAERRAVRRSDLVVPVQRADGRGARADQRLRGLAAALGARPDHARPAGLDGRGRQGDHGAQARFMEGLHDRRSAQPVEVPVAARRREADVSVLRQGGEVRASRRSASTRDCCRPTTRSRMPASGSTRPPRTSARRRRTGRR